MYVEEVKKQFWGDALYCKNKRYEADYIHSFAVLLNVTGFGKTCHLRTKINIEKYVINYSKCKILRSFKLASLQYAMNV